MAEINTREDIQKLVNAFYARVKEDDLLAPVFNEVVGVDWATHLPRMYQFWETVLFHTAGYKGNPVLKHVQVAAKTPLQEIQFDRWVALWCDTVDGLFEGPRATAAKERAQVMAKIMFHKCSQMTSGLDIIKH